MTSHVTAEMEESGSPGGGMSFVRSSSRFGSRLSALFSKLSLSRPSSRGSSRPQSPRPGSFDSSRLASPGPPATTISLACSVPVAPVLGPRRGASVDAQGISGRESLLFSRRSALVALNLPLRPKLVEPSSETSSAPQATSCDDEEHAPAPEVAVSAVISAPTTRARSMTKAVVVDADSSAGSGSDCGAAEGRSAQANFTPAGTDTPPLSLPSPPPAAEQADATHAAVSPRSPAAALLLLAEAAATAQAAEAVSAATSAWVCTSSPCATLCTATTVRSSHTFASPSPPATSPFPTSPAAPANPGFCAAPSPSAASAPTAAPAQSPSQAPRLLAVNPGIPAAMRRPVWTLEDYDVQKRLFKSSTSSVYSGTCLLSGLPVALKVYWLDRVPANVLHMLRREIRIQSQLVHKNVVMLYGAFQDPVAQRLILVEEFAANGDLHAVHKALGCRMNEQQARALVLQPLLEAVAYLHSVGVVHRDIKPDNILFTQDWRLVLGDFGIAIDLSKERAVTRAGTVGYMAPEVERCPIKDHPEDNKDDATLAYSTGADVFGIGCLAYTLLLGFPPFVAGSKPIPGRSKALSFPASTSQAARDFICGALAECAGDRPTAMQVLQSSWMMVER